MKYVEKANLHYVKEHLTCGHYLKEVESGFFYEEFKKGFKRKEEQETQKHYLVIIMGGKIRLTCNLWKDKEVREGEIFLIARSSLVSGECLENTKVLTLAFDIPITNCDKFNFQHLAQLAEEIDNRFEPLPVRYPINIFCELMSFFLQQKASCEHLHEAKHNELFLCLRYFYTKQELAGLFYPILSKSMDFQRLILDNYKEVRSVQELIELSHMSRSSFYDKFKEAFGVSAKQWLTNKKLQKIINVSSSPNMTVKQLMVSFQFDSLPQFQRYCKKHFGCTPSELIENARSGNAKIICVE